MAIDWNQIYDLYQTPTDKRKKTGAVDVTALDGSGESPDPSGSLVSYLQWLQGRQQAVTPFADDKAATADSAAWTKTQYWTDLAESIRRYTQDFGEAQRQFGAQLNWTQNQYWNDFGESKRRYDQEFPWMKKRDAYSIAGTAFLPNARMLSV